MNENIVPNTQLTWTALEYEHRDRNKDWFWALGVIVFTTASASTIFGNYFFAILIILSGALLGFFATREPDTLTYQITDKGLVIKNQLYAFKDMKSFFVQREPYPILFVKTARAFMPILSIPIHEDLVEYLNEIFTTSGVTEEEMKEHPSEKIMDVLGF